MSETSQSRAVKNYRSRLAERGMARFEVLGRVADRELIRSLARRLAEDDPDAHRLRTVVSQGVGDNRPLRGAIPAGGRRAG